MSTAAEEKSKSSGTQTELQNDPLPPSNSPVSAIASSAEITTKPDQMKGPDVVQFSPETGMIWASWLRYFESVCINEQKDEVWKIRNIHKYLKDSALTLYINNCLNILHWNEFVLFFTESYSTPDTLSLTDFSNIKFKCGDDLNAYYQNKTKMGRSLGLDSKFILEGLTEGLPLDMRKLVIANAPDNPNQWRELVFRLNKLQSDKKAAETKTELPSQNQTQYRQWRPPRQYFDSTPHVPRQWNYRVPYSTPPSRPFNPSQNRSAPFNPRPNQPFQSSQNFPPRPSVHHQTTLPPSPCRVCLNIGIPNAYHWVQDCPFRKQNLEIPVPQPNTNNVIPSTSRATNDSPQGTSSSQ